ncbi:MAG: YggS family pyridoxal phosphate-dependent enzyme [Planctomycetota bacterium]
MTSPDLSPGPLEENLYDVRQRIANAARAAGRVPGEVQLLPVTKAVDVATARALVDLGELELAENRAHGLQAKALALAGCGVRWHFIGHLQRNKAARVVRHAHVIHSVDSARLVSTLQRLAREEDRLLGIYLQVDFTGEATKHGLDQEQLAEALAVAGRSPSLELLGLMAMAPLHGTANRGAREVFERVAALAADLQAADAARFVDGRCRLSMGMSGDLAEAVRAGSTCVRVGGALFRGESPS